MAGQKSGQCANAWEEVTQAAKAAGATYRELVAAQWALGSLVPLGALGRRFESCRPDSITARAFEESMVLFIAHAEGVWAMGGLEVPL
jgi:hypothetical protein